MNALPTVRPAASLPLPHALRNVLSVFKLRIGFMITVTAVVGMMVTPGAAMGSGKLMVLMFCVMLSSASAGAFNQYYEFESDRLMARTRDRVFATGALRHSAWWLVIIAAMLTASVGLAAWALNPLSAAYIFLGAFFYAIVYTMWLKRRSWLNIVIGGLAGSFAVLAGAAAIDQAIGPLALIMALVLFLWTPPHFWSLAIAGHAEYAAAGVPMLPVVVGVPRAARTVFWSTVALALTSLLPAFLGAGPIYLAGAAAGGGYFVLKSWQLAQVPCRKSAMGAFFASLVQLSLLFAAATLDSLIR